MQIILPHKNFAQIDGYSQKSHRKSVRLLVVDTLDYQAFHIGGTLSFIKKYLKYSQFDFCLVGLTDDDSTEVGERNNIVISTKAFDFLPVAHIRNHARSYRLTLLLNCLRYRKRIKKLNYNGILIQSPESGLPFILSRIPIFYRMAGATNPLKVSRFKLVRSSFFQSIFTYLFFLPVVKKATKIFSINEECEQLLKQYHVSRQKIKRIYLGIDRKTFQVKKYMCREKLRLSHDDKILVYTGRLSKAKGIALIIDALTLIRDKSIKLIIVGDGEEKENIRKQIFCKKLTNVLLVGPVEVEEVPIYLRAADVFCIASYYEGLSNSMIEALGAGLPIISTNVAGAADIVISGENGIILHDRDPQNYARAIQKVLKFDMKEVREINRKLCDEKFNIRNIVKYIDKEIIKGISKAKRLTS